MFRDAPTARGGTLRTVRRYFGLSQADLAPLLGVSQARVAEAESSTRPLPQRAWGLLTVLAACMSATGASTPEPGPDATTLPPLPPPPPPDPLDPLDAAALRARQQQCAAQATRLRFRLGQLAEHAAQARRRLAALPTLRAAIGPPPATDRARRTHERQTLWLALFENEARQELARSGATSQALLLLRLGALEYEAAHARELLKIFL